MSFEYLTPVSAEIVEFTESLPNYALGKMVRLYADRSDFPDLQGVSMAIIVIDEYRNSKNTIVALPNGNDVRKEFYALYPGNWDVLIADLGTILSGETVKDTYFAIKEVVNELLGRKIIPIILGGSQDVTYAAYRGYDYSGTMVNMVGIDNKFDLSYFGDVLDSESYMNAIIQDEPANLVNFTNLGYQTYYNSQEASDLMDKLFFERYRLGEVIHDVTLVEPVLRNADLVSLDVTSVQGSDIGNVSGTYPNGFNSREICAITRYAGISEGVSCFGIYNMVCHEKCYQLTAQLIWYFIEGYNYRYNEYVDETKEYLLKYIVPLEEQDLYFYKSTRSERWWMKAPVFYQKDNNSLKEALIPCTYKEYTDACNQIMPERWWRAYRKSVN